MRSYIQRVWNAENFCSPPWSICNVDKGMRTNRVYCHSDALDISFVILRWKRGR